MNRAIRSALVAGAVGALAIPAVPTASAVLPSAAPARSAAPAASVHAARPVPIAKGRSLSASVGPGFDISTSKRRVRPGMYTIRVTDLSSMHNFHLQGPGVNKKTKITTTGTKTWNIRFRVGTYRFQCDMHPTQMFGQLKVARRR